MLANTQLKGLAGAFQRSDTVSAQCVAARHSRQITCGRLRRRRIPRQRPVWLPLTITSLISPYWSLIWICVYCSAFVAELQVDRFYHRESCVLTLSSIPPKSNLRPLIPLLRAPRRSRSASLRLIHSVILSPRLKFTVIIKHWEKLTLTSITPKSVCPGQAGNFEGWANPITCLAPAVISSISADLGGWDF